MSYLIQMFKRLATKIKDFVKCKNCNTSKSWETGTGSSTRSSIRSTPTTYVEHSEPTSFPSSHSSNTLLPPRADSFKKREYANEEMYFREIEKERLKPKVPTSRSQTDKTRKDS